MMQKNSAAQFPPNTWLTCRSGMPVRRLDASRIGVDGHLLQPSVTDTRGEHIPNDPKALPLPLLSPPDLKWLETFESYIWLHLADELLSVPGLAKQFAMSESTLLRQLKRLTGLSPIQYLQEVRLDEARRLIESRRYDSIAQVASQVGYPDARSFARSFRARFGKLPSEV